MEEEERRVNFGRDNEEKQSRRMKRRKRVMREEGE